MTFDRARAGAHEAWPNFRARSRWHDGGGRARRDRRGGHGISGANGPRSPVHRQHAGRRRMPSVTPSGIPRYYIAASGPQRAHGDLRPVDALVMDAQTGAVLATVEPPAGYSSFALFGGG